MKKLTIRLSDDLHTQIAALAKDDQRSLNKQVIWIIEAAIEARKSQNRPISAPDTTKESGDTAL